MKPSSQRLIVILGSLSMLIGMVYVFMTLVYPSYQDIKNLRGERQSKAEILDNKMEAEKKIEGLVQTYNKALDIQSELSSMLPNGPDANGALNALQAIARSSSTSPENFVSMSSIGFEYTAIKQPENPLVKGLGVLRMNVNLLGTYEALRTYISQVETNMRIMDVSDLKIGGGAVPNKRVMNYNLIVDAYYQEN